MKNASDQYEHAASCLRKGREGTIQFRFGARVQDIKLQPECFGRAFRDDVVTLSAVGLVGLTISATTVAVGTNS